MNKHNWRLLIGHVAEFFEDVKNNDVKRITRLIQEDGVDVNSRDCNNENRTALHVASLMGFCQMVYLVDKFNADIDIEDNLGEVPLHVAADNHNNQIVKFFVEKGSKYSEDVVDMI